MSWAGPPGFGGRAAWVASLVAGVRPSPPLRQNTERNPAACLYNVKHLSILWQVDARFTPSQELTVTDPHTLSAQSTERPAVAWLPWGTVLLVVAGLSWALWHAPVRMLKPVPVTEQQSATQPAPAPEAQAPVTRQPVVSSGMPSAKAGREAEHDVAPAPVNAGGSSGEDDFWAVGHRAGSESRGSWVRLGIVPALAEQEEAVPAIEELPREAPKDPPRNPSRDLILALAG